jgi:arylsulfatase A-like enzyme
MDLTATILELAGARHLPAMDGVSLLDLMTGPDRAWTVPVVTEGLVLGGGRPARAGMPPGLTTSGIRTGRYKLIRYATGEAELYDLLSDPNELDSVWNDPAHRAVRLELMQQWLQYRSCRGAGCRVPLPPGLQQDPEQMREQHEHARHEQRSYYGR